MRNLAQALAVLVLALWPGLAAAGPAEDANAVIESHDDHRIAMAFSIASLIARGETEIRGIECVGISYPNFFETLRELTGGGG